MMPRPWSIDWLQEKLAALDVDGFNEYLRLVLPNYIAGSREFGGVQYVSYWIPRNDLARLFTEYFGSYNSMYLAVAYRSWASRGWVYELRNDSVRLHIPTTEAPTGLPAIMRAELIGRKTTIKLNKHLAKSLGLRDNQRIRLIAYRLWGLTGPHVIEGYVAHLVLKVRLIVSAPPGEYLVMSIEAP